MVSGKQQTSKKYLQQGYRKHKKNRKILELKNTMTELKTSVERINSKLKQAEETSRRQIN